MAAGTGVEGIDGATTSVELTPSGTGSEVLPLPETEVRRSVTVFDRACGIGNRLVEKAKKFFEDFDSGRVEFPRNY